MIRVILLILPIIAIFPGCAAQDTYVPPLTLASSHLLFDRAPGWPTAEQIVRVGDWPATRSFQSDSEQTYYREVIHDLQGNWPSRRDYTYRRFHMMREGSGRR